MARQLPKLSYVLLSHNREKYIRRAIESAFAQDYEGELEYIFSDDCSTDRTFEIIKECAAAYKGPRRVVVTQTPHNMHLAGNTNHAVSFVESDWVIRADDDDIACVDRCSIIGKAIAEHPEATFVYTTEGRFVDKGEDIVIAKSRNTVRGEYKVTQCDIREGHNALKAFTTNGCSHRTWHVRVYRDFGPLPLDGYYVDDIICAIRANMLGCGLQINADTVFIRDGSNNMCRGGDDGSHGYNSIIRREKFNDKYFNITLSPLQAEYERSRASQKGMSQEDADKVDGFLNQLQNDLAFRKEYAQFWRKGVLYRWKIYKKYGKCTLFDKIRCLPMPVYAAILATYRTVKHWCKR